MQQVSGVVGDADAELAFGLGDRAPDIDWILPDRVEDALQRAPGIRADARRLPVGAFLAAEVRRIGDPLYGQIRRLAALVDADVALVPVRAASEPAGDVADGEMRVRIHSALLDVRTGRVLWFGVQEGAAHRMGDPAGLASAVDAVSRTLLWYYGRS